MASQSFYPNIGTLLTIDDFPAELQFLENGLQNALDKIYYKQLQYVKSDNEAHAFYDLVLVTDELLKLELSETRFSAEETPILARELETSVSKIYGEEANIPESLIEQYESHLQEKDEMIALLKKQIG